MSKLANLVNKPTLLNYAQGAAQKATNPVADFLAPPVEVSSKAGFYKVYNQKQAMRIPQTKRALNGRAVELYRDASDTAYLLDAHAIDAPVDQAILDDEGTAMNELMGAADDAAAVGGLAHEKQVIDLALAAVGSGTDYNFASTSVDPVDLIDEAIINVIKAAGYGSLMGVGVLFGATAFRRYKNNTLVRARFVGGSGGKGKAATEGSTSLVTPGIEAVTALQLGNPEARVSLMVYDANAEGLAASNTMVLDTAILVFARMATPNRNDPSFMKTFRPRGQWMVPGTYVREDGRATVAKMDWYSKPVVTNSAAAIRINANAS